MRLGKVIHQIWIGSGYHLREFLVISDLCKLNRVHSRQSFLTSVKMDIRLLSSHLFPELAFYVIMMSLLSVASL